MEGYFFPTGVGSWFELSGGSKTEGSRNRDSIVVRGLVSGDEVWPSVRTCMYSSQILVSICSVIIRGASSTQRRCHSDTITTPHMDSNVTGHGHVH